MSTLITNDGLLSVKGEVHLLRDANQLILVQARDFACIVTVAIMVDCSHISLLHINSVCLNLNIKCVQTAIVI